MTLLTIVVNLVEIRNLVKGKVFSSVTFSKNIYYLVHTVGNDLIAIKVHNTQDSEAV